MISRFPDVQLHSCLLRDPLRAEQEIIVCQKTIHCSCLIHPLHYLSKQAMQNSTMIIFGASQMHFLREKQALDLFPIPLYCTTTHLEINDVKHKILSIISLGLLEMNKLLHCITQKSIERFDCHFMLSWLHLSYYMCANIQSAFSCAVAMVSG